MDTCIITPITPGQTFEHGELHWYPITRINIADSGDPVYAYIYKADIAVLGGGIYSASYGCVFADTILDEQDPQPVKIATFMPMSIIFPNLWSVSQSVAGEYIETSFYNEDTGTEYYITSNLINGSSTIGYINGSNVVDLAGVLINYTYRGSSSLPVASATSPALVQYGNDLYWKKQTGADTYIYIKLLSEPAE